MQKLEIKLLMEVKKIEIFGLLETKIRKNKQEEFKEKIRLN